MSDTENTASTPRPAPPSLGVRLFAHALRMLAGNGAAVLKISALPFGLIVLVQLAGNRIGRLLFAAQGAEAGGPPALFLLNLAFFLLTLFLLGWAAVAWHRFILCDERPGLVPPLHPRAILAYLGRGVLVALVMLTILFLPMTFSAMLLGKLGQGPDSPLALGISLGMNTIATWLVLVLAPMLVGAAIGKPMGLADAFRASGRHLGALLVAAFLFTLFYMGLGWLAVRLQFALAHFAPIATGIVTLLINWLVMMTGFSLLTTVHGHVVERRPLG